MEKRNKKVLVRHFDSEKGGYGYQNVVNSRGFTSVISYMNLGESTEMEGEGEEEMENEGEEEIAEVAQPEIGTSDMLPISMNNSIKVFSFLKRRMEMLDNRLVE